MSIPPGQSDQPPGGLPPAGYPAGGPTPYQQQDPDQQQPPYPQAPYQPPAPTQGTSGLAIAGLILAFLAFPIGLILSIVAFVTTGAGKKKGRGLAVAGIVVSLLITGGVVGVVYLVKDKVQNITTIADPGCTQGKDIIVADGDLGGANADVSVIKSKAQSLVTGLDKAAAAAKHDNVRAAMAALSADYKALIAGTDTGQLPKDFEAKVTADGNKIDELCTLGGVQK
jgi:hypothetical protein